MAENSNDGDAFVADRGSSREKLLAGHFVGDGEYLVLLIRKWTDPFWFIVDEEYFEKLTIEIKEYTVGVPVNLGSDRVRLYYSRGASAWFERGAGAYAAEGRGKVIVTSDRKRRVKAVVDVAIEAKADHPGYGDRVVRIHRRYRFRELSIGDLTPWLGEPNPPPHSGGYPD